MTPHLLQSDTWEHFQETLGSKTLRIPTQDTQCLGLIERSHGVAGKLFKRLYVPYGPTLDGRDGALSDSVGEIERSARLHGCDIVRIEPMTTSLDEAILIALGYVRRPKSTQPSTTNIVSLDGNTDEVVARMNATNRNLWRKNVSLGEEGVQFRIVDTSKESHPFFMMMHETSLRSGAKFHTDEYFGVLIDCLGARNEAGVMIASVKGVDVASALFVVHKEAATLYYLHAGSIQEARKYNAGNILVSNLILYAKSIGMSSVDLFGVAPVSATETHPLYGISKFKRAYGGVDVSYHGTWEKSLSTKHKVTKRLHALVKRGS